MRRTSAASALVLALAVAAGATSGSRAATTAPTCPPASLRLSLGRPISPVTGEHALELALVNRSSRLCALRGYPGVNLLSRGRVLPFAYKRGGGRYVTSHRPGVVLLRPGSRAYLVVAKYRCDVGDRHLATEIRVRPPGDRRQLRLALPSHEDGVATLSFCRAASRHRRDPGNVVELSPVAATERAAFPP